MRKRNKESVSIPRPEQSRSASEQDLAALSNTASQLWQTIRQAGGSETLFPGFTASFDASNDRAEISKHFSPVLGAKLAIFYDDMGTWNFQKTSYGPGTESEPHGTILAATITCPVSSTEPVMREVATYRQKDDRSLALENLYEAEIGTPLSDELAHMLLNDVSTITGRHLPTA